MTKKIIIAIVVIALVVTGFYLFRGHSNVRGIHLEIVKAQRGTITNTVTATGTIEAVKEVEVGTQVSGIIDKIYVDYNSVVKKGQVIAEMDRVNLQAELKSGEAQLASARAEYEYQLKNYNRNKQLHDKDLIADADYESSLYNFQNAKAAYNQAQASIVKVRQNLGYATITSPIDGVVISRAVEEGQTVASGFSTPTLFTIAKDLTDMRVIAAIDEADIGNIKEGDDVNFTVDAYPNDIFKGKVTQVRLEATVTSNVTTYSVVISAPNPDLKLKPGLTANVSITTLNVENILTIPAKAFKFVPDVSQLSALGYTVKNTGITAPEGKKVVWQLNGKVITPKLVTIGNTDGIKTEITEGLTDGDAIIKSATAKVAVANDTASSKENNPFMPKRPDSDRKKQGGNSGNSGNAGGK